MANKIARLYEKLTPAQRARAAIITQEIIAERPLFELRRARRLSQVALAAAMELPQSNISRIENQTDAYLSTLRNYVEAMNGKLRLVAEFPDGSYEIANLHDLDDVDANAELTEV